MLLGTGTREIADGSLANREFAILWSAETSSLVGDQLAKVAVSSLVYTRTGSALLAAMAYALVFLPALLGGLGLAQLADRLPRRGLLTASFAIQGVAVLVMALRGLPLVFVISALVLTQVVGAISNACLNALGREVFEDSTAYATVPLRENAYRRAQDLRGVTGNAAVIGGLGLGGVVVATLGPSTSLVIDAATFLVAAVLVRIGLSARRRAGSRGDAWFGGLRWLRRDPAARLCVAFAALVGLSAVPDGLAPVLAEQVTHGGTATGIGLLLAADPVGFVIGTLVLSRLVRSEMRVRLVGVLSALSALVLVPFWWRPGLLGLLGLLVLGGACGAHLITVTTLFTRHAPNSLRAGVLGVYRTVLRVSQGLGVAAGGAAASWLGSPWTAVGSIGAAGLVLSLVAARSWKRRAVLEWGIEKPT